MRNSSAPIFISWLTGELKGKKSSATFEPMTQTFSRLSLSDSEKKRPSEITCVPAFSNSGKRALQRHARRGFAAAGNQQLLAEEIVGDIEEGN